MIVCVGRKRSGKDTFFEQLDENFVRISFADNIKKFASSLFLIPLHFFYDDSLKEVPIKVNWSSDNLMISPRDICTTLGAFCRNNYGNNFWIDRTFSEYKETPGTVGVVTDARYINEVEYILNRYPESRIYYIDADERIGPMPDNSHESETSVYLVKEKFKDKITFVDNNRTISEYINSIKNLIKN